jgi:flagellar basal body-associated protein FliL
METSVVASTGMSPQLVILIVNLIITLIGSVVTLLNFHINCCGKPCDCQVYGKPTSATPDIPMIPMAKTAAETVVNVTEQKKT